MMMRVLHYITERNLTRQERAMRNLDLTLAFVALVFTGYAIAHILENAP